MNRYATLMLAAASFATVLQAQTMSADVKESYAGIKSDILNAAQKMPADGYSFKPTNQERSFGGWVAHVADAQLAGCSRIAGAPKNPDAASKTSKADLVAALKASFDACDPVYDALTEANAKDQVPSYRGPRPRLTTLFGNVSHDNECYGAMAVYLRLKGILPPSTEAEQARQKK